MGRLPIIRSDDVLDAAQEVVLEQGPARLTLDAVAAQAGISKGGLQYSFGSKEALIRAMLARQIACLDEAVAQALADEPATLGREGRAYVKGSLSEPARPENAALLAAVANNIHLLTDQRGAYRAMHDRLVASGTPPVLAKVVMLATDGFLLLDLLGMSPFDEEERAEVTAELCRLATPKETAP